MKQIFLLSFSYILLLLVGCKDPSAENNYLKLDPSSAITLSNKGGVAEIRTINVSTNIKNWQVVSDQSWCMVSQSAKNFTIEAQPNTTNSERKATITVSGMGVEPTRLALKQLGSPIVPSNIYSFDLPDFSKSKVYKIMAGTDHIAQVVNEYLYMEGKLDVQVVTIYLTNNDGLADLANGFVAKITKEGEIDNSQIVGGRVSFDSLQNTITQFSNGGKESQNSITINTEERSISFSTSPVNTEATQVIAQPDQVTDIDGNSYQIVKIGTQYWMAENLKTTKYNDGRPITHAPQADQWTYAARNQNGVYCTPMNDPSNTSTYGLLYNAYAIGYERKMGDLQNDRISPKGWKLPSGWKLRIGDIHVGVPITPKSDMDRLMRYLQGSNENGAAPKMRDPKSWRAKIVQGVSRGEPWGNNLSLFTATGSGFRSYLLIGAYDDGEFSEFQHIEGWWCSTIPLSEESGLVHYNVELSSIWGTNVDLDQTYQDKGIGLSIRCLKK